MGMMLSFIMSLSTSEVVAPELGVRTPNFTNLPSPEFGELQEEFTGTTVDTFKGTIVNPDAANIHISQNGKLIFTRVTDTGITTATNFWESFDVYTRGVVSTKVNKEVGFVNSVMQVSLFYDDNNRITIRNNAGVLHLIIRVAGVNVYDFVTSVNISINRIKISYDENNDIKFYHYTGAAWAQLGTTQNFNVFTYARFRIAVPSSASDGIGDILSFDDAVFSFLDYATELPVVSEGMTGPTISGLGSVSCFSPNNPTYTFGMLKNSDGKYYFGAMGREDRYRDPYIYKYNSITKEIEQRVRIPMNVVATDTHRVATLTNGTDGHIYVAVELLTTSAGDGHGTTIHVYKTTVAQDISTLALIHTIPGRWSYPEIYANGQDVFLSARGKTSAAGSIEVRNYHYWTSTDGGSTWSGNTRLFDTGVDELSAYVRRVHDYNGGIYLVYNERGYGGENNWLSVSIIKHVSGNTWSNLSGSFTKDVTSTPITRTEMMDNCLILESPSPTTVAINFDGGVVKSSGDIKLVVSVSTQTGNFSTGNPETTLDEIRFYTYSGGSWSFNNIEIPATPIVFYWAYEKMVLYRNTDEDFDDVVFIDLTDDHNVYIKRSKDNFVTHTTHFILGGNLRYRMGYTAYNAVTQDDAAILVTDTIGDILKISGELSMDYSDMIILNP